MEESMGERGVMILTRANFQSEFRDFFRNFALTCGEAGEILLGGVDIVMRPPVRDMMDMVAGPPGGPALIPGARMFGDNARGDRQYEVYEKRYRDIKEGKKRLIAKLLMCADKDVTSGLTTSAEYAGFYSNFDILGIFQLTEQVCMGRGAVSVYASIVRLLQTKQHDQYNKYAKEFKEMVVDLNRQGTPEEVLGKILNALFILGLNQEQFKDKLSNVYGNREWPDFEVLSAELHTFAEATERMGELRTNSLRDNNEGKITAHVAKSGGEAGAGMIGRCWNCGSSEHQKWKCNKPEHRCGKCGKSGHLEKYCRHRFQTNLEEDNEEEEGKRDSKHNSRNYQKSKQLVDKKDFEKKKGNFSSTSKKMSTKARVLKKVLANLINSSLNDWDDDDEDDNADENDSEDNDDQDGTEVSA
jgi:hypothetical protein